MTSPDADWDLVYRSSYESAVFLPAPWIERARDLYESARKLEPAMEGVWKGYRAKARNPQWALEPDHYTGPYFMLVSFAVENLLKAAAMSRKGAEYRDCFRLDGKFPSKLKGHDLVKLSKFLCLEVNREEDDLLHRLTRAAIWFGRYPAPVNYSEMSGIKKFSDGKEYRVSWFGGKDVVKLTAFIDSLPARLGLPEVYWKDTGQKVNRHLPMACFGGA